MSAGKKYDAGKAPVVQAVGWYFPRALMAVAQVSAAGAKKYNVEFEDKNWSRLDGAFKRYTDGLGRHLLLEGLEQYDTGRFDPTGQSGTQLLHAAQTAWNALARLELLLEEGVPVENPQYLPPEET